MNTFTIKHSMTLVCFVISISCFFVPQTIFCQTEKLGIVSYTPPKSWTKTLKPNVVTFSDINQSTGSFCIITVHGETASSGNPTNDFTNDWNEFAVKTLKAAVNPQSETRAADGWTVISGAAAIELEGSKAVAFLTVYSGYGKKVSVIGVFNNQSYMPQLEAFISSLNLDKTVKPINIQTTNQSIQPGKFGSMSYASPAGWSEQQFPDGVVFKPLDVPAGEHLAIQIMTPLNTSGTLEQALAQSFDEATTMYKATNMFQADGKYGKNPTQKSFNGWEYIRGKGSIKVQDGTQFGTEYGLELFVIKINNRFERIAILESRPSCKPLYSRYYTSDRIPYRNAIENLLFSLQFADYNETALKSGSIKGNGVIGVWQGTIQSNSASGLKLEVNSVVFLTNGQVYFGSHFPNEGFDGLNTRVPAERNQRDWASYTFSNGKGILKMLYAEIPFRIEGSKLILTKNQMDWAFFKLNPVDGAVFNGTYSLSEVNGKIPSITFTSDGKFTDNGALKVLYHEYIDCMNPANSAGSGTYEVKDYSVIFNYLDGRKLKLAFFGTGYTKGNTSPSTLKMSFDDNTLTRQ